MPLHGGGGGPLLEKVRGCEASHQKSDLKFRGKFLVKPPGQLRGKLHTCVNQVLGNFSSFRQQVGLGLNKCDRFTKRGLFIGLIISLSRKFRAK